MLLVVEFQHDDLMLVGVDDALGLLGGLIQDVDFTRDAAVGDDVEGLRVADGADRAPADGLLPFFLVASAVVPHGDVHVDGVEDLHEAGEGRQD